MTIYHRMLKPLLRFVAAALVFASVTETRASHYLGGNITWECQGGNDYLVTMDLFFDCTSGAVAFPQTLHISSACASFDTIIQPPPLIEVSQVCAAQMANTVCNGGSIMGVWQGSYQVVLNLPPCPGGYRMWWALCCRPGTVDLTGAPGIYVEGLLRNDLTPCNDSPVFGQNQVPTVCIGQPVNYNFGVTDPEGDSLAYSLIGARGFANSSAPIGYIAGHTAIEPVSGTIFNPVTGQLQFTPTAIGTVVFVVAVQQFDAAGNYIGTVMRDIAFICIPCTGTPPQPNDATLNGPGGPGSPAPPGSLITAPNTIEVCNGLPVCFSLVFNDPDPATTLAVQTQAATLLPGSIVNVTGTNPLIITVCWTGNVANSPVNVVFQVNDGACPIPNNSSAALNITSVIPPTTVDAGTNAVLSVCTGSAVFNLIDQLGGTPQTNGNWKAPDGTNHGDQFDPATDPAGVYTYRVGNACVNATSTVTISFIPQPVAGTSGTLNVCSNSAPVALATGLGGTPDAGGTWTLLGSGVAAMYDPATQASGVYVYTVTGGVGCTTATANVTVTENAAPNAGVDASTSICANGTPVNLFGILGGTPAAGGTWSGGIVGGMYDPAVNAPGSFIYTVNGTAPCANATATITVTEPAPPNAGTDASTSICANGAAVNLFGILGGTPTAGGTWSGGLVGGMYDPAANAPGSFVYTVNGTAPCANATATITVTEPAPPNAGTDASVAICANGAPVNLFGILGGTPAAGGTWSGGIVGGMYNPAVNAPGSFIYTVNGTAPCANATATITVTEPAPPNAGTDASVAICANGAAVNLFGILGGTPTAGGTWSGGIVGGMYDPAVNVPGSFVYTVNGTAPCANATATITVTEPAPPNAGTDASVAICANGAPVNLFGILGGTPTAGGTWSGGIAGGMYDPAVNAPGSFVYTVNGTAPCANATATITVTEPAPPNAGTDASVAICANGAAVNLFGILGGTPTAGGTWSGGLVGGMYDPAANAPGSFVYTVNGTAPCANATATITVTEPAPPNAGTDASVAICANGAPVNLFGILGGTPAAGGTWSGGVIGGMYDPAVNAPGSFVYTVNGTAPCANATATITVTEPAPPNAGTDASVAICANGAAVNLFGILGGTPTAGGTWSGGLIGGMYDPAVNAPGSFVYTVNGTAPCANATATITVTEPAPPNAGTDASTSICANGAAVNLFGILGGTPTAGGTWSGGLIGGMYDPAVNAPGSFVYTVNGTAPCANATATITVTETTPPDAGIDGVLNTCANGAPVALFPVLGGSPDAGGTWSGPNGPIAGQYDPATMDPGIYTYTIAAAGSCAAVQSNVTVNESAAPNAGADALLSICSANSTTNLYFLLTGAEFGGSWTGPLGFFDGTYEPGTDPAGTYIYTVNGVAPCLNDQATVVVTETAAPVAGRDTTVTLCANGAPENLFGLMPNAQGGGSWFGGFSGTYTPGTTTPGTFTYSVPGTMPCLADQADITIVESAPPSAGTNASITVCDQGAAVNMLTALGTADPGGTWSGPSSVVGNMYDPATMNGGAYVYTVTGTAPCANASATVTVTETGSPNAGTDGAITLCSSGALTDLFAQLGGSPDGGGSWSGGIIGGILDPSTLTAGPHTFTYTLTATAPCTGDNADVVVTIAAPPVAGTDASITVCDQGAAVNMLTALGTADPGGAWAGPSTVVGNMYDPTTMNGGAYVYTLTGPAPCANASATVTVTETGSPNAGTDGAITLCSNGPLTDLFAQLGGSPDGGGSWSGGILGGILDPSTLAAGSHTFTYTLTATAPCTGDNADVVVTIAAPPVAGTDASITVCDQGAAVNMFTALGTADPGGAWSGPSTVVGNMYDPATMIGGAYLYTVTGTAPCTNASATVTVTETGSPNAGTDGAITLCSSGALTDLFAQLGGSPDGGGTWSGGIVGGILDPSTLTAGPHTFTYTLSATAPCTGDDADVVVTIAAPPVAGTDASITVCDQGTAVNMLTALGTADPGGAWAGPSTVVGNMYDPATMIGGAYVYTVTGTAPCTNASATVTVTETGSPNAGTDGAITLCSNGALTDLFAQLGGSPDGGGTWSGGIVGGILDPSTLTAGPHTFTYTLSATAPCTGDNADVVVTIAAPPVAGIDASITVCDQGAAVNMLTALGTADPGGAWIGPSTVVGNMYDPATMNGGAYVYTVTGTAPCANASATVTVTETGSPNAGTDGAITLCSNGPLTDLFAQLGGSPDGGGSWSGGILGGILDPSTLAAGPHTFTYTLTATAPCTGDNADVVVTIAAPPVAGTAASITVCDQGAAVNMLTALGTADPGGAWAGPSTVVGNMYDPTTMNGGAYVYTVTGTAPCANASATVTVTETGSPNAGTDGTITLCSNGALTDLFAQLGGSPDGGGTWSGGITGGILDPSTLSAGPHTFTYTLTATAPCTGDNADVVVNIAAPPVAGTAASITVCDQGAAVNMLTALGTADPGGAWAGPSTVVGNMYDPTTMNGGAYVYTLTGTAPCANASATVTVTETGSPNAGTDGTITLCSNGALTDLFAQLGGSPHGGGTWSGPSMITGGIFDPSSNLDGTYTYTISGTAPCMSASSNVVVSVEEMPNAGTNGIDSVCTGDAPFDLSTVLQGVPQPGGTWTLSNAIVAALFDPAVSPAGAYTYTVQGSDCPTATATATITVTAGPNAGQDNAIALCSTGPVVNLLGLLSGMPDAGGSWNGPSGPMANGSLDPAVATAGAYTYTVSGNASCPAASATIMVSISQAGNAGSNGALSLCSSQAPVVLFSALTGSPNGGGTWTGPSPVDANGTLDPGSSISGNYTYTVTPVLPCPAVSALVDVAITQAPSAGMDADAALCSSAPAAELIDLLAGSPDPNGVWTDPNGNASNGTFTPGLSTPGLYAYEVPAIANCPLDSSSVIISVSTAVFAGNDGDTIVCANGADFPMTPLLQGPYDTGGQWSGPQGVMPNDVFHPGLDVAGTYLYTVIAPAPCVHDVAQVVVQILAVPTADPTFTIQPGCLPTVVTFNSGYNGEGSCAWDLGNGITSDSCGTTTVTYTMPGNYNVTFTADPGNGCIVEQPLGAAVVVANEPTAAFNMVSDHIGTLDPVAAFSNQSTGATAYHWDFDGLGTSRLFSPQFSFPFGVEDIYTVCLTAFATPTCYDTLCADLLVPANASAFVPNAFSPDGDGHNELFTPITTAVDRNDYSFIVVDRWGQLVFSTDDPFAAWDGHLPNGSAAPIGVYVWKLSAMDAISATKFERIGHVTLVR